MLANEKLLREIFKKTKYEENFFYGKFLDSQIENKFSQIITDNDKIKNLCFRISIIVFMIIGLVLLNIFTLKLNMILQIILIILIIINVIILIISLKTRSDNSRMHLKIDWIKYLFQLSYFYFLCILFSIKVHEFKLYIFSTVIIISYFLMSTQLFHMKHYSKITTLFTFIGYLLILIFDILHSHKLMIIVDKKLEICQTYFCTKFDNFENVDLNSFITNDNKNKKRFLIDNPNLVDIDNKELMNILLM